MEISASCTFSASFLITRNHRRGGSLIMERILKFYRCFFLPIKINEVRRLHLNIVEM